MNTQVLVDRMLTSLASSTSATIEKYLKVFGVIQLSSEIPVVFDPSLAKHWKAFLLDRKYSSPDPRLRTLLTILDFIRFMRQQHINPFIVPTLNSKVRPLDLANSVQKEEVKETCGLVLNYMRKVQLLSYFKITARIVQLSLDKKYLNINFSLVPIRKEPLTKVILLDMRTLFSKASKLPPQFEILPSTPRFSTVVRILGTTSADWVPLTSISTFKIYARAAKDALALRVVIPVNYDYIHNQKDLQALVQLWKNVKV